jgi:hypothetical protein
MHTQATTRKSGWWFFHLQPRFSCFSSRICLSQGGTFWKPSP